MALGSIIFMSRWSLTVFKGALGVHVLLAIAIAAAIISQNTQTKRIRHHLSHFILLQIPLVWKVKTGPICID